MVMSGIATLSNKLLLHFTGHSGSTQLGVLLGLRRVVRCGIGESKIGEKGQVCIPAYQNGTFYSPDTNARARSDLTY